MGAFLEKPKTEKHNENGHGNGLWYGVGSMQGWRMEMEDSHQAIIGLDDPARSDEQCKDENCTYKPTRTVVESLKSLMGKNHCHKHIKAEDLKNWSYFAVFDGHAGAKISAYCADHLLESILKTEEFQHADVTRAIRTGFLKLDSHMRNLPDLASGENKSGSTAVCALISPTQIFIANCGDSRALICRNGTVSFATRDHKPFIPMEKERIQKAGGTVVVQRVNGALAVSRAMGDYEYKNVEGKGPCEQLVSPEPEVSVIDRDPETDEYLVLACDGIWDVMQNEMLCEFVRSRLLVTDDLQSICNQVIDTCLYKGSRDNMSIVLVTFPAAPKVSEEAVRKEAEYEAFLKQSIIDIVNNGTTQFSDVLDAIEGLDKPVLPTSGGICSKRSFIEQTFRELYPDHAATIYEDYTLGTIYP